MSSTASLITVLVSVAVALIVVAVVVRVAPHDRLNERHRAGCVLLAP